MWVFLVCNEVPSHNLGVKMLKEYTFGFLEGGVTSFINGAMGPNGGIGTLGGKKCSFSCVEPKCLSFYVIINVSLLGLLISIAKRFFLSYT